MIGKIVDVVPIIEPVQLLVAVGAVVVAEHCPVIVGRTVISATGAQTDVIAIVCPFEFPQLLNTVTVAVPLVAMSAAGITAVSSLALMLLLYRYHSI